MEYRSEIDGLRAIAVLPVILYHAGFQTFKGGFVGVDVFFVISGYLITTIIVSDLNGGNFSLLGFYERRARRILPVLLFIMVCCLPFAWLWFSPSQLKELCQSIVAVTMFSSNLFFWKKSGYFDTAAEVKPLLHTWSLAVEEQYYLFFPLILMLMWKKCKSWIPAAVMFGAGTSFMLAQYGSYRYPQASFFLLPTRGWEIAIGAVTAFYLKKEREIFWPTKAAREVLGSFGLILIGISVVLFDKNTPFPLVSLVPVGGAALIIIFSTTRTVVGRLLGTKPLVAIGLISYSAYLWHQPLFAFARYRSIEEVSASILLAISVLSIILAFFTWRLIELPFRDKVTVTKSNLIKFTVAASISVASVGLCGHIKDGFRNRFDSKYNTIVSPDSGNLDPTGAIEAKFDENTLTPDSLLFIGDASTNPTVALVGDSHAYVLTKSLSNVLKSKHKSALVYARSGNLPFPGVNNSVRPINREHMHYAYRSIVKNKDINTVVLVARWALYLKDIYITDDLSHDVSLNENLQVFTRGLKRAMDLLSERGIKVVILGDVPEYDVSLPEFLAKSYLFCGTNEPSLPPRYRITRWKYESRAREVLQAFNSSDIAARATYIDSFNLMSAGPTSNYIDTDHNVYYVDNEHLSYSGSKIIVSEIGKYL